MTAAKNAVFIVFFLVYQGRIFLGKGELANFWLVVGALPPFFPVG